MAFVSSFQTFIKRRLLGSGKTTEWPFIAGKYRVFDTTAPVVIAGSHAESLAEELAALETPGVCMVATQCRSVTDVVKLIKNIAANLAIQNVLVIGDGAEDSPILTLLPALLGADVELSAETEQALRKVRGELHEIDMDSVLRHVRIVNMPGTTDIDKIVARISELALDANRPNTGFRTPAENDEDGIERVMAASNVAYEHQPDKAGNFYICVKDKKLVVEHFSAKNELVRVIEGTTARDLCITLIRNGWVSRLDLGRELLRAELAMKTGEQFVPDRTMTLKLSEEELIRH